MERIVLAYSGGLDTSVAIPWLAETLDAEVVAVTLDVGKVEGPTFAVVAGPWLARDVRRSLTPPPAVTARSHTAEAESYGGVRAVVLVPTEVLEARSTRYSIRSPPPSHAR